MIQMDFPLQFPLSVWMRCTNSRPVCFAMQISGKWWLVSQLWQHVAATQGRDTVRMALENTDMLLVHLLLGAEAFLLVHFASFPDSQHRCVCVCVCVYVCMYVYIYIYIYIYIYCVWVSVGCVFYMCVYGVCACFVCVWCVLCVFCVCLCVYVCGGCV